MTIFMEASLKERQVYIVFRPSFCIKNMTHNDLYCNVNNTVHKFAFAEQIFIQESEQKQLIYIQSLQQASTNSIVLNFGQDIPSYGCAQSKFFRIEKQVNPQIPQIVDLLIWPTYQIRNDCLKPITLLDNEILPGQIQDFYCSPLQDFVVPFICLDGYQIQNFKLATLSTSSNGHGQKQSAEKKQLAEERSQTKLTYEFATELVMKQQVQRQTKSITLGVHRHFKLRENATNQFQHMIIIYPKVIFRNLLATLNQSENYDCVQAYLRSSKKAKEKFEVQAKLGEAVHTKADENSTVDIIMKA